MAIQGIPVPKSILESFMDTQNQGIENQLKQAQMQEAYGKARQSQAIASLFGGGDMQQGGAAGTPGAAGAGAAGMSLQDAMKKYIALGQNFPAPVDGTYHTAFGDFKAGQTEPQKQAAGQTLKDIAAGTIGGASVNESIRALKGMLDNPDYAHIAGTAEGKLINAQPLGIPFGSWLQHTFPGRYTKEDAKLAGQAVGHMGNIVTGVAAKFKGPFKQMTKGVIDQMKPNLGDSIELQRGKLESLQRLSDFADQINSSVENDINNNHMDPAAAAMKAVKEFSPSLNSMGMQPSAATGKDMVTIIDSNGDEHQVHKSRIAEARQIDPGLKVKK